MNHYRSQASLLISVVNHWSITDLFYYMESHNLKPGWHNYEHARGHKFQSRDLGWVHLTYRCIQSGWGSGIQSWEGRIIASDGHFSLILYTEHQETVSVPYESNDILYFFSVAWQNAVYSDNLWMNMLWHCPFQIKFV